MASLNVVVPRQIDGLSVITNADNNWYSESTGAFTMISPGNKLFVSSLDKTTQTMMNQSLEMMAQPTAPIQQGRKTQSILRNTAPNNPVNTTPPSVCAVSSSAELSTTTSTPKNQTRVKHSFQMSAALRVVLDQSGTALALQCDGKVGLCTAAPNEALTVKNGDARIETGGQLQFQNDGLIVTCSGDYWLGLPDPGGLLTVSSKHDIAYYISAKPQNRKTAKPQNGESDLFLKSDGNVGLGTLKPAKQLSANGKIHASKGLIFEDNSIQIHPAVPIPIGAVIDWWRKIGDPPFNNPSFQICDGRVIKDPDSPYAGKRTRNLLGKFVHGVTDPAKINTTGGDDTHSHKYSVVEHTHPMPHDHKVQSILAASDDTNSAGLPRALKFFLPGWLNKFSQTGAASAHSHSISSDTSEPDGPDTGEAEDIVSEAEDIASAAENHCGQLTAAVHIHLEGYAHQMTRLRRSSEAPWPVNGN